MKRTFLAPLAIATALALSPSVALAQSAKSEAILGAPSALALLVAQQNGTPIAPAAYRPTSPSNQGLFTNAVVTHARPALASPIAYDRPNVFGSVALAVSRTPLDYRWRKVERTRVAGAPAAFATALRDQSAFDRLDAVNRYVNSRVAFTDDIRQYRTADLWSSAGETLRRGRGDCEDYAIAKLQMLRHAGFADRDLYLVVVKDLVRRSDHAVLVVRAGDRMLLLDNGTDTIADAATAQDYRPILSFASGKVWTHGYQRSLPPVTIAEATPAPIVTASLDDQRSRNASLRALSTGFNR
jgi:predicted transglutaminase-like cysteine proteinase